MVNVKAKDFIELDFTGIIKETNEVFDTTLEKDAKSLGIKEKPKPMKLCVGEKMLPEKFESFLEGKEEGKEYFIELPPKEAFGERRKELVKMLPLRLFTEKRIMPYRGLMLNMDEMVVKVISVSGGRVIADFNNPLAGKTLIYNFKIKRVIEDKKEKVSSFFEIFFKLDSSKINIEIKDKKAFVELSLKKEEFELYQKVFENLSEKAKSLLDLEIELKNKEVK